MDGRKRSELKRRAKSTHKWLITLWSIIICVWVGLAVSYFVLPATYGAETQVLLNENAATARDLVATKTVQQSAASAAGVSQTALKHAVHVTQHQNSRVVTLGVSLPNAHASNAALTNMTSQLSKSTQLKVISAQKTSKHPDVHLLRNGLISAALGLAIGLVIAFWPRPKYLVTTEELDAGKRRRR